MTTPQEAEGFAAFATFLGTPLPENPIAAIRILRREAAAEIERLIAMLDALGGDPDLEPNGDENEPTLGWPASGSRVSGSTMDGETEPSLGWTGIVNQASRNRLGEADDYEKDDSDAEPSLGAAEQHPHADRYGWNNIGTQTHWGRGDCRDLEGDEHDGREPEDYL